MLKGVTTAGCVGLSVIPSSTMCGDADRCVSSMEQMFQSLPPNLQAQFQQDYDTIMNAYNSTATWYGSWIPFNTGCESVYAIGQQADNLTSQMNIAMGGGPIAGFCCNAGSVNPLSPSGLLPIGLIVGVIAVLILLPGLTRR